MRPKTLALLALLLSACNLGGAPKTGPTEKVDLEVLPDPLTLSKGGSADLFLVIPEELKEELKGELFLKLENPPPGVALSTWRREAGGGHIPITLSADEETASEGTYEVTLKVTSADSPVEGIAPFTLSIVEGQSFAVDVPWDTQDANPGDGKCADSFGKCSLRAAVMEANASELPTTIKLRKNIEDIKGIYTLERGALPFDGDITIKGEGRNDVFIAGIGPLLEVYPGRTVKLEGVSLLVQNPSPIPPEEGGVLYNAGYLTLKNVVISGGKAKYGGGIYNDAEGLLLLEGTIVEKNVATEAGGGLYNEGILILVESEVRQNTAPLGQGGGIYNAAFLSASRLKVKENAAVKGGGLYIGMSEDSTTPPTADLNWSEGVLNTAQKGAGLYLEEGGTALLSSSTFRLNVGEAIYSAGLLTLLNTTLSSNGGVALNSEGETDILFSTIYANQVGVSSLSGTTRIKGTILQDCVGTLKSEGYNVLERPICRLDPKQETDLLAVPALLGLLEEADPVWVHRPLLGSPFIDQVPPSDCTDFEGNPVKRDALGARRPIGKGCSIGAVED